MQWVTDSDTSDDSDSESESETEDHEDGVVGGSERKPNDPEAIARTKAQVQAVLSGVCRGRCFVCNSIINLRQVKRIDMQKLTRARREQVTDLLNKIAVAREGYNFCLECHFRMFEHMPEDVRRPLARAVTYDTAKLPPWKRGTCYICYPYRNTLAKLHVHMPKVSDISENLCLIFRTLFNHYAVLPGDYDLCATCRRYVMKNSVPPSAVVNGFSYPRVPTYEQLELIEEQRLHDKEQKENEVSEMNKEPKISIHNLKYQQR